MNNWNWSDDRLRHWTPRHPSPELRARVFGPVPLAHGAARTISEFSRWLVPAFGCFLLVMGGLSQRGLDSRAFQAETNDLVMGGNSRIMLAGAREHSEINAIPVKHMQYSLGSNITQPASAIPTYTYTNHLIQQ